MRAGAASGRWAAGGDPAPAGRTSRSPGGAGPPPPVAPSRAAPPRGPIIAASGVRFRYADSPTDALAGVNLTVAPGEFLAVLGGNGSGKSTLARVVGGLLLPAEGRVLVAGLDTRDPSARIEVRRRIGLVFQNPDNQIVAALVEDDIAFGPENLGVPPEEIGRRVAAALAAVGMSEYARRDPHHLSGGQKQRVAIAAALAMQPDCVCLDEPTSLLDPVGRAEALAAIHALHSAGGAVILITHHAAEAAAADRAVVLAAGRVVADAPPAQLFADPARLRAWGVEPPPAVAAWAVLRGRGLDVPGPCLTMERLAEGLDRLALQTANPPAASAAASGGQASASAAPSPPLQPGSAAGGASSARAPWGGGTLAPAAPGPAALQPARADHAGAAAGRGPLPPERPPLPPRGLALDTVRFTYPDPAVPIRRRRPAVDGVDLRLAPGECLALLGATGSGKSTLALLACTLLRPDAGVLVVDGEQPWRVAPRARRGALRRARRMVGLVFQHPEDQFFEERVLDEVSFAPRNYGASPAHAAAAAREALRRAGLADELAERSPFHLSGGQMRRVAIAALLAAGPRYLLLDEPTAGLDADGRAAVIALVRELRSAGVGILLITHRMEEAAALADRVAILHGGELVAAGSMRDVFALGERLTEWGLHPPAAAELLEALRRRGWRLPPAALTLEEACRAIVGAAAASGAPIRPPAPSQRGAGAAPDGPGEGAPACSPA